MYELSVRDLPVWTICRVLTKSRENIESGVGDRQPNADPLTKSPYAKMVSNLTKSENRVYIRSVLSTYVEIRWK
jgi:hypothetical protein